MSSRGSSDFEVLLRALRHPRCPREADGRIQLDRFFGFAYTQGAALDGIEPRADALVRQLGGRREDPEPEAASRLPYYRLPASSGD